MPGTLPEAETYERLIEALEVFAPGELDALRNAAEAGMTHFAQAFFAAMNADPRIATYATYVLYRTLGTSLPQGLASAAPLWPLCQNHAHKLADDVRRAGHEGHGHATVANAVRQT